MAVIRWVLYVKYIKKMHSVTTDILIHETFQGPRGQRGIGNPLWKFLCQFLCLLAQVLSPPRNLSVPQQFEMPALELCYIGGLEYEIHHLALSFSVKFIFHVLLMLAWLL